MTAEQKLIKSALESYRMTLSSQIHDLTINNAGRDWAQKLHSEVVDLLDKK